MHHITRRLSPSLLLAIGALFVALAGTAVADVIITSSDQLGDDVVTERSTADDAVGTAQLKDRAVTQLREAHPHLRARVNVNGAGQVKLVAGDVNALTGLQRLTKGKVRVTFDTANTLGFGKSLAQCAFTATPELRLTNGAGAVTKLRIYTDNITASTVDVITTEDREAEGEKGADASFSLVADC
jgi:hypothetical protein